jgi:hypothetical protein
MELYYIYLQLSGTVRIVIEISLLVLAVLWFYLPFAVISTNRRLTKLLESNKQVENNTHRIATTLKKLSWDLADSAPDDEAVYEDPEPKDETEPKVQHPRGLTCRKCNQLNDLGTKTCTQCNTWL